MTGGGGHDSYLTNYQTKTSSGAPAPRARAGDGTRTHDLLLGKLVCPFTRQFVDWKRAVMASRLKKAHVWNLASVGLLDGFTDFILSRQPMNCTLSTLQFYRFTAGVFLA